jgi:hypothetical protein
MPQETNVASAHGRLTGSAGLVVIICAGAGLSVPGCVIAKATFNNPAVNFAMGIEQRADDPRNPRINEAYGFEARDVVTVDERLIAASPEMVVEHIRVGVDGPVAACLWFTGTGTGSSGVPAEMRRADIPAKLLKLKRKAPPHPKD